MCVFVCVCLAFSVEILTNILNHNLYSFQGITTMLIYLEINIKKPLSSFKTQ